MLKPFAVEFQPFIDDITGKERTIEKCANMATMERIRGMFILIWYHNCSTNAHHGTGCSDKFVEMENLLKDIRVDIQPLLRLNG